MRVRPGKRFGEVRRCRGISGRGRRDRGGVRTADEEGGGAMARNGSGASVAPDPDPLGAGWGDEVDRGRSGGYGRRGLGFGGVMGAPAGPAWLA